MTSLITFANIEGNLIVYYHNLKFDGSFWIDYLLRQLNMKQACDIIAPEPNLQIVWQKNADMDNNTFKYSISDRGMWYTITIKTNNKYIELRDSLKLLPFSVKKIGKSFGTKHKKLDMEYEGLRYAGCEITPEEKKYISNDVLVVKEALEIMYEQGHNRLTIGSCCYSEYAKIMGRDDMEMFYPNLYNIIFKDDFSYLTEKYGYKNAGEYIRRSYKGGWCYVVRGKEHLIRTNGTTADVNSLYPSMMHSESGNRYPVGKPKFWKGDYIPEEALKPNKYYFVRVKTRFYLKKDRLPFIQIKGSFLYKGTESLESSDVYDKKTDAYYETWTDEVGNVHDTRVELVLTMTDWALMQEQYELVDCEILDGCYFYSEIGLFDAYIDKYKKIKMTSTGAIRELAKLFLNNLYGKMATSTDSSFKYAYVKEDGVIGYRPMEEYDKIPGYIAIGSAITSYARNFTIRAAQANYYGVNKRGFIYADTDSIHCDLMPNQIKGIKVHDTNFCCWKLESQWDVAIFTRQKTYIEHIVAENGDYIEEPYYNIKCAGMPARCKELFQKSMEWYEITEEDEENGAFTEEEKEFIKTKRTLKDFTLGLKVPSKLMPRHILGGTLLVPTTYEMR